MKKYPGYAAADWQTDYAAFYNEQMAPLSPAIQAALDRGALPAGTLPAVDRVNELASPGYQAAETGYTLEADGSLRVAVLTPMPGVTPVMWDWWFGWHGCRANRYKLWHPRAHRDAAWRDGSDAEAYVGRVSLIEEYIGPKLERAAIQFVSPGQLGFASADFADPDRAVYVCARLGHATWPVDFGWLVHQIRATADGAEMRSRFWMGGRHLAVRGSGLLSGILQKAVRLPETQARDLLVHCAEEMAHLAAFLPALYKQHTFHKSAIADRIS